MEPFEFHLQLSIHLCHQYIYHEVARAEDYAKNNRKIQNHYLEMTVKGVKYNGSNKAPEI